MAFLYAKGTWSSHTLMAYEIPGSVLDARLHAKDISSFNFHNNPMEQLLLQMKENKAQRG